MQNEMIRLENFRPRIDEETIAEKTGANPERISGLVREAATHIDGSGAAMIAGLEFVGDAEVKIGDKLFTSPFLVSRLDGLGRAFPYLVTEGAKLAAWGANYRGTPDAPIVHLIRQAVVKGYESEIEKSLCGRFAIPVLSSVNPGSLKDWPLSEQKNLLALLAPLPAELGVSLLPSGIMQPDYSISGIFYQTDKKYYNCQFCPRDNCPNRKAPKEV